MNPKSPEARDRDEQPFEGMNIESLEPLNNLMARSACSNCGKSRMYFCYTCFVPVPQLKGNIPLCSLPVKVDIIKHRREIDGKSTAAHAAVLAPFDVTIYTYPEVPDYKSDGKTVLLYPGIDARTIPELFSGPRCSKTYTEHVLTELPQGYNIGTLMTKIFENHCDSNKIYHVPQLPVDRVVLIDSTWNQSRGIFADKRLQNMPKIVLQKRASQFWRHQKGSPRWYLSTVEALHQVMLELHLCAWGRNEHYKSYLSLSYPVHSSFNNCQCKPYNGQYDNLLYFFKYMYEKLHKLYKHENMLAYKRQMT